MTIGEEISLLPGHLLGPSLNRDYHLHTSSGETFGTRKLHILVCVGKLPMYFNCVDFLLCPLGELTLIVQVVSMSDLSTDLNLLLKSVNLQMCSLKWIQ